MVFLWGQLDDAAAGQLAAELMTLDATGDDPVQLHIDCPGGTLEAALCLVDVIDLLGVDVIATCVGQAVGPAIGPLAVAHRRQATPHARFRLSEPVFDLSGPRPGHRHLGGPPPGPGPQVRRTPGPVVGTDPGTLARDLATGRYLDAAEALEYGLIDEVCGPRRPHVPPAHPTARVSIRGPEDVGPGGSGRPVGDRSTPPSPGSDLNNFT